MTDIEIEPGPFGARVLTPLTPVARTWCASLSDINTFRAPDGCMTGFPLDSVGVEACDFDDLFDDIKRAGLTTNLTLEGSAQ